jgi:hypothetical protein
MWNDVIRALSFTSICSLFSHALPPCEARPLGEDTLISVHLASSEVHKALQIQPGLRSAHPSNPIPTNPAVSFPTAASVVLAHQGLLLSSRQRARMNPPTVFPQTLVKWPGYVTGALEKASDRNRIGGCP